MRDLIQPWSLTGEDPAQAGAQAWVRRTCDRIEAVDAQIQAFVGEPERRTRLEAAARALGERWPAAPPEASTGSRRPTRAPAPAVPPLLGIPVGVKDIIRVDGLPTQAGSALPPEALAGPQAAVVDRLIRAGAIVAGKTVTAEFAALAPGPTRNPHHLGHTPGGSSSGSAAAVAAGMVPLAIGTQTIGSVIRPAAYCGITGFKPGFGRIPVDGVIANAPSFDTLGCYATDVYGISVIAAALCTDWSPVSAATPGGTAAPMTKPTLGIPVGPYLDHADAEARTAFQRQVDQLRRSGYEVREVPAMSDFDDVAAQLHTMDRFELARTHAVWFQQYAQLYREQTAAAIREGQRVSGSEYAAAQAGRERFKLAIAEAAAAAQIEVWICPAATGPAPAGLATTGSPIMCLPWSHAGLPSISLPAGRAGNGLPLGLQCVAAGSTSDEQLIAWSFGLEQALKAPPDQTRQDS